MTILDDAVVTKTVPYITLNHLGPVPVTVLQPGPRASEQVIDAATRANLELTRTMNGQREGSLLAAIDRTVTACGARMLAGRLAAQVGAHYLEREAGGRGILLGGVPGVSPADVLVLGGGVEQHAPEYDGPNLPPESLARLLYGMHLAQTTHLPLAYSGGIGWGALPDQMPEAQVAARVLARLHGPALRWQESLSRDTRENAERTAQLLRGEGITRTRAFKRRFRVGIIADFPYSVMRKRVGAIWAIG